MKSTQQKAGSMHSVNLTDAVRMWPTPTSPDVEKWSNNKDRQSGKCLEAQARSGKMTGECGLLNPDWVEWLMGDPIGWTDINADVPHTVSDGYWDAEPDIPRVAGTTPDRADRLHALGNKVVPQQFYPIFATIAEIETNK